MIRLHIIAEGQTEEEFVNTILTEHLGYFNISTDVHCITTKRTRTKVFRGGLPSYQKIKKDIIFWLRQDKHPEARFTTMCDLYALPNDFPEFEEAQKISDPYERVEQLENALFQDINDSRFIPYIQLHEFEALILSEPIKLEERFPNYQSEVKKLVSLCQSFESPELINDGEQTAPSKRIIQAIPGYEGAKVSVAPLMAQKIGLENIRQKCPHFNQWIERLENLSQPE
ncbi:DUF4276 family protein [Planktothrix agardhii 1806]|jgi:hypothetical protein|uniref:DUF4276 family protein n=1 Tax=Planktothrix agardhii TaxID=1160 RepID=UPI001D0A3B19|nr:DUF4276 family protein [Planktothrix agardhii]MCB8761234.1 DUF4276 family protein [Planktothrix agardhii 1813]MCF3573095.1 DUF4276 family protein [Planktothrix agardhii 1805]MCF3583689.1 DUF4276 family protein [Planktothrix agardhii 1803]MCF3604175.1 DUF4276 family protein [Planktothrix agardhii 1804]MCF3618444.1 DUF4276 family protein [Planktothrix agardhii 1806]